MTKDVLNADILDRCFTSRKRMICWQVLLL